MNDFHLLNSKHNFDQLDATNFNQWQNLTFRRLDLLGPINLFLKGIERKEMQLSS